MKRLKAVLSSGAQRPLMALLLWIPIACLAGCGGGGAAAGDPNAPSRLTYENATVVYRTADPIVPNTPNYSGGMPTTWAVNPALPDGLALESDGMLAGTPTTPTEAADYVVTASNGAGQTSTTVNITVLWQASMSLAPKASPTDDDLRHFLNRTHFGFSQTHYDSLKQVGLAAYVDQMTTFADTSGLESEAADAWLKDDRDPDGNFPGESDLARWWLQMIMLNPNPFQESLAFHWHDHFATSASVLSSSQRHFFIDHVNLWRHGGAGNLRQVLTDLTRDSAMLIWLDGVSNRDGAPNENFAREFFELFCLGVDIEYTQPDIVEAARAFTGYRVRFDANTGKSFTTFDPARHDETEKSVLGQTIPAQASGSGETDDFAAMVELVLTTNEAGTGVSRVGQWIARSLLEYYCYQEPPQNVIDELANNLRAGGWELKPILMTLFQSEAFFSAKGRESLVKGPMEHIAGFMRSTNLLARPSDLDSRLRLMDHRPTQPPTVDGWPSGTAWLSAQGMVDRANLLHFVLERARSVQSELGLTALALLPTPNASASATVDALAMRLRIRLTAAEHAACVTYLDTERDNAGTVTPDPFDATGAPAKAEDRVRGLLWILGQHPTYQVR